ncbi:hypothetical protein G3578_19660 [Brevibacillus sp. SYP-B805]|uniref:tetratricopeptide repeat protein n=1 Tax=Brevibacillus sp. SYP-B805 TaxID=1578199 RepID=UPI0013EC2C1C|nr:hypothetical protein [Brevibacillus sp. SYP-B805]NGQ97359.1 hypothetical protein [Brevibacillus sp. SYP-B805]
MHKRSIALLLAGIAVTAAPFAAAGTNGLPTVQAETQVSGSLPQLLTGAYQTLKTEGSLPEESLAPLRQQLAALLPLLKEGIALSPQRLKLEPGEQGNRYLEWRFWLEIARQLHDPRTAPYLLAWLSDPRSIEDEFLLTEALLAVLPPGQEEAVADRMDTASAQGASVILQFLQQRSRLGEERMAAWLKQYAGKPQMNALIAALGGQPNGKAMLHQLYEEKKISVEQQRQIVQQLLNANDLAWLQTIAATTTDTAIEQMIDISLVLQHGDRAAAKRLYASGMERGFTVPLSGITEKFLADLYPDGKLKQGIEAYQKIRGVPYFYQFDGVNWYSYESRGSDFSHPREAIGQWLSFIRQYPHHPALDDAAYRLARCYQQIGEYERALYWFDQAKVLGDRDLQYDADGQFLYVLDVEMTAKDLERLDTANLPAWTKEWAAYSLAVEYLRQREYGKAAEALERFVAAYQGDVREPFRHQQDLFVRRDDYPFWDKVNEQLALARQLAAKQGEIERAAGAEKAKRQYELAALIYHQPLLYYNHLWRGERQSFFWFGQIKYMDYQEKLDRYIERFNHLVQAADAFSRIDLNEADPQTGANTLFSLMLAHAKLIEYGEEVKYYASRTMLGQRLLENGQRLLKRYPASDLADDALLLMYQFTGDTAYLQQLLASYPHGDQADKAKQALGQAGAPKEPADRKDPLRAALPYQTLAIDDWKVPENVKAWARQHLGKTGQFSLRDGEWLYALLVPRAGERAYVTIETDRNGTYFEYTGEKWEQAMPSWGGDRFPLLLRLPYRFVQHGSIQWHPIGG